MSETRYPIYHRSVGIDTVRAAWAVLTLDPQVTVRALAMQIGTSRTMAAYAITTLRNIGYVEYEPRAVGTRRIVVPFAISAKRTRKLNKARRI